MINNLSPHETISFTLQKIWFHEVKDNLLATKRLFFAARLIIFCTTKKEIFDSWAILSALVAWASFAPHGLDGSIGIVV